MIQQYTLCEVANWSLAATGREFAVVIQLDRAGYLVLRIFVAVCDLDRVGAILGALAFSFTKSKMVSMKKEVQRGNYGTLSGGKSVSSGE